LPNMTICLKRLTEAIKYLSEYSMPSSRFEIDSSLLLVRFFWASLIRLKKHTYIRISRRKKHSNYERNTSPLSGKRILIAPKILT